MGRQGQHFYCCTRTIAVLGMVNRRPMERVARPKLGQEYRWPRLSLLSPRSMFRVCDFRFLECFRGDPVFRGMYTLFGHDHEIGFVELVMGFSKIRKLNQTRHQQQQQRPRSATVAVFKGVVFLLFFQRKQHYRCCTRLGTMDGFVQQPSSAVYNKRPSTPSTPVAATPTHALNASNSTRTKHAH